MPQLLKLNSLNTLAGRSYLLNDYTSAIKIDGSYLLNAYLNLPPQFEKLESVIVAFTFQFLVAVVTCCFV